MLPFSYLDLHNLCFRGYADKLKFDDLIKENEAQHPGFDYRSYVIDNQKGGIGSGAHPAS